MICMVTLLLLVLFSECRSCGAIVSEGKNKLCEVVVTQVCIFTLM